MKHAQTDVLFAASDVGFSWGDHEVLRSMTLSVEAGTVVCLMGTNGCGKSTFLDCILGENVPSRGSIIMKGKNVATLSAPQRARLMAYVPQIHDRTFPYSVRHIVLMGRASQMGGLGSYDAEDEAIVASALETCGISALAERPCTALSGGEMQMVLLARALAQNTPLIVLDEPTAHLDFRNELLFLETVEHLVTREHRTILMATHVPNQAFHLVAAGLNVRVALMAEGKVARFDTPDTVLTEENLRDFFGIRARSAVIECGMDAPLQQIVAVSTIERKQPNLSQTREDEL